MSRDPAQGIADVLAAIERCQRDAAALGGEAGMVDRAEDAIERNRQIIGEAVNHLPEEVTDAHPDIPWPQIRGFRNILVHQYVGVDVDVVETHLPSLADALRSDVGPRESGAGSIGQRLDCASQCENRTSVHTCLVSSGIDG